MLESSLQLVQLYAASYEASYLGRLSDVQINLRYTLATVARVSSN